jgi:hypothetical protein
VCELFCSRSVSRGNGRKCRSFSNEACDITMFYCCVLLVCWRERLTQEGKCINIHSKTVPLCSRKQTGLLIDSFPLRGVALSQVSLTTHTFPAVPPAASVTYCNCIPVFVQTFLSNLFSLSLISLARKWFSNPLSKLTRHRVLRKKTF